VSSKNYAFTEWQQTTPFGVLNGGVPGNASNTFPLNDSAQPWFRDRLDALRSGRIPTAEYPDGYLGTLNTRRGDRLQSSGGENRRSYERGVHVGSRVPPSAYFWPDDFNPALGLSLQAQGKKFAPSGDVTDRLTNDGKPGPGLPRSPVPPWRS
jgi:hypothetical protein